MNTKSEASGRRLSLISIPVLVLLVFVLRFNAVWVVFTLCSFVCVF